jgi:hypothetical protein
MKNPSTAERVFIPGLLYDFSAYRLTVELEVAHFIFCGIARKKKRGEEEKRKRREEEGEERSVIIWQCMS